MGLGVRFGVGIRDFSGNRFARWAFSRAVPILPLSDTFSGANGTNLHGRAPSSGRPGEVWSVVSGSFALNASNQVLAGSIGSKAALRYYANLQGSITAPVPGNVWLRADSTLENGWRIETFAGSKGATTVNLYEVTAGVSVLRATNSAAAGGTTLTFEANGTSIQAAYGAVSVNFTSTAFQSQEYVGLGGGAGAVFDSLAGEVP